MLGPSVHLTAFAVEAHKRCWVVHKKLRHGAPSQRRLMSRDLNLFIRSGLRFHCFGGWRRSMCVTQMGTRSRNRFGYCNLQREVPRLGARSSFCSLSVVAILSPSRCSLVTKRSTHVGSCWLLFDDACMCRRLSRIHLSELRDKAWILVTRAWPWRDTSIR